MCSAAAHCDEQRETLRWCVPRCCLSLAGVCFGLPPCLCCPSHCPPVYYAPCSSRLLALYDQRKSKIHLTIPTTTFYASAPIQADAKIFLSRLQLQGLVECEEEDICRRSSCGWRRRLQFSFQRSSLQWIDLISNLDLSLLCCKLLQLGSLVRGLSNCR